MPRGERRLYVGNLPYDIREKDIEDMFHKFGKLVDLKLKIPRGGNPFCFLEFESAKDAEDALRRRNNYVYAGSKIRVEYPTGPRGRGGRPIGGSGGGGGGGRRGGAAFSRSEFRVRVTESMDNSMDYKRP